MRPGREQNAVMRSSVLAAMVSAISPNLEAMTCDRLTKRRMQAFGQMNIQMNIYA